jgi:hypothetical protein
MQESRPPAAQLLYDCGAVTLEGLTTLSSHADPLPAPYPSINSTRVTQMTYLQCAIQTTLQLCMSATPPSRMHLGGDGGLPTKDSHAGTFLESYNADGDAVRDYPITARDLAQVYISPHAYKDGFPIELDLQHGRLHDHLACGMKFTVVNGRLILQHIEKSTLASKIPCWCSELHGAWLQQIGDEKIHSLNNVHQSLASLIASGAPSCTLIFSHPEIRHGLTNDSIPQVNIDQLNPKTLFLGFSLPGILVNRQCGHVAYDGDVYNFTSLAMQLTQGKLLKTVEWSESQQSEFTMLDQYKAQGLFGKPVKVDNNEAVFNLVWTYVVKELDKHNKARCTCNGLTQGGQVCILDHTYANFVDQTGC